MHLGSMTYRPLTVKRWDSTDAEQYLTNAYTAPSYTPPAPTQSLPSFTALPPSNTFSDSVCYACIGSYSSGGSGTPRSK